MLPELVATPNRVEQKSEAIEAPQVVEIKAAATETPKAAEPKEVTEVKGSNRKPTSSLFNLSKALAMSGHKETANESEQVVERRCDVAAKSKIEGCKAQILKYLEDWRPRFVPFFNEMQVEGSTIKVRVPTEELNMEILRNETQLLGYIVEVAKIDGAINIEVSVEEMVESKKPVRLEDRIAHFTMLNPALVELTEQLDMQVDG